ncbi:MAG TPA: hypothetical protein VMF50_14205 [Candidatus Binataceae bacterium]|nr:hypothetical protein [Candidatus Binataceae bacterium]
METIGEAGVCFRLAPETFSRKIFLQPMFSVTHLADQKFIRGD